MAGRTGKLKRENMNWAEPSNCLSRFALTKGRKFGMIFLWCGLMLFVEVS